MQYSRAERIKVMHILEASIGGTRRHILTIADNLDTRLFDLYFVLSPTRDPDITNKDTKELNERGFHAYQVNMVREISFLSDLRSFFQLVAVIKEVKPDIIHTHASKAGVLGRLAARAAGVKHCVHTPHLWAFDWEDNALIRCFYASIENTAACITDEVIAVSKSQCREALDWHVADKRKLIALPNAVELKAERTLSQNKSRFVIGSSGRLVRQKGFDILLDAFAEICIVVKDCELRIAGDGKLRTELERQAHALGIADRVNFLGHVPDIDNFLAELDVFAMASRWEGMPYSLLEAMAIGLPVIATKVNGVGEILYNGFNGLLVPSENSSAFAKALQIAYESTDERAKWGHKARLIVQDHNAESFARALEWRYLRVLEDNPIFHA